MDGKCCPEGLELTAGISALASAMASCLSDEELGLAAVIVTQLGDTLTTLSVRRAFCARQESAEAP